MIFSNGHWLSKVYKSVHFLWNHRTFRSTGTTRLQRYFIYSVALSSLECEPHGHHASQICCISSILSRYICGKMNRFSKTSAVLCLAHAGVSPSLLRDKTVLYINKPAHAARKGMKPNKAITNG